MRNEVLTALAAAVVDAITASHGRYPPTREQAIDAIVKAAQEAEAAADEADEEAHRRLVEDLIDPY